MTVRAQAAEATRRVLLDAASFLLDHGGVDAVTLREVGERAGVSRTAAYRHFADKEDLLMTLAAEAWDELAARLEVIAADPARSPSDALLAALEAFVAIARTRADLYRLMFARPGNEAPAATAAASRAQEGFLGIVARVSDDQRTRPTAGLLLAAAHGVADLELSGHLEPQKWRTDGDGLLELLVRTVRDR